VTYGMFSAHSQFWDTPTETNPSGLFWTRPAPANEDGSETPLYYRGRSTTHAEQNCIATHLELAALLATLKAFHSYLINTEFEIVTDHISLTYLKNL